MALSPRRMVLAVVAVASIAAPTALISAPAYASSVPAPTLVSPASSPTTPVKDVILQWNPVPGATEYQVQISPNKEWTNNQVTLPSIDGGPGITVDTIYEVPISLPHGSYFWHVRAHVGGVWSKYSTAWQFLRAWPVNSIVILKAPTSADPTITWAPVQEASLYEVIFQDMSRSGQPLLTCNTEQTSFTPYNLVPSPSLDGTPVTGSPATENIKDQICFSESNLIDGDSYKWTIRAYDDTSDAPLVTDDSQFGDPLACSLVIPECGGYLGDTYVSPTTFEFVAPQVGTFDPTETATGLQTTWHRAASVNGIPCDTANPCPITPTFSWNPTPGANYYRVDVFLDPDHTTSYRTYQTAWPELTPRDFYLDAQAGAWYYWRVQPETCEPTVCAGQAGAANCTTTTPGTNTVAVAIAAAGGGAVVHSNTEIDGIGSYTVTLTESAGNPLCAVASAGQLVGTPTYAGTSIQYTYFPPAEGSVTFSILNEDGTTSAASPSVTVDEAGAIKKGVFSSVRQFAKESGPVTLTSPSNGATIHGVSPTLKWADWLATGGQTALEARNYHVQVSTDPNFDSFALDLTGVDLTQLDYPKAYLEDGSYYWRVAAISESGEDLTWSPTYHFTVDATAPTISFSSPDGVGVNKPLMITTNERITGINSRTLKIVPQGMSVTHAVPGTISKGINAQTYEFIPERPLGTGVTYVLVPDASLVDNTGSPVQVDGSGVRTAKIAHSTSKAWTYSAGWHKSLASSAFSGAIFYAGAGRRASVEVGGTEVALFGCLGPDFGKVTVSVAGHSQTVSEHQKFTQCGQELWHHSLPATERKLTVSVVKGVGNIDEVEVL